MERQPGIGPRDLEFKIQHRGLFIQPDGIGDGPGGVGFDLTPVHRIDFGVRILNTDPDYETVFRAGIAAAKKVLRTKLPDELVTADIETISDRRMIDFEESSLKRGTIMNKWAEEFGLNKLPDAEMTFLNGCTVETSVIYMQCKILGASLDAQELEALKGTLPTEPKLRDLKEDDPDDQYSEQEVAWFKRNHQVYSDISALTLLKALQQKPEIQGK